MKKFPLLGIVLLILLFTAQCGEDEDPESLTDHIIVVGSTTPQGGNIDWWIKKFDSSGNEDVINWNKVFDGGLGTDIARAVAVDADNNVYVAGSRCTYKDMSIYVTGWWIKKFDSQGVEDTSGWDKQYFAGLSHNEARAIAINSGGEVFVAGGLGSGDMDWVIKKFSSSGTEDTNAWNKTAGTSVDERPYDMTVDSTGNLYVVGSKGLVSGGGADWWLKKYNANGVEDTVNWDHVFSSGGWGGAYGLARNEDGEIFVCGQRVDDSTNKGWLRKMTDAGGEHLIGWPITVFSGNGICFNKAAVWQDSVYFVGRKGNSDGLISSDWLIKKYNRDGTEDTTYWDKEIDGANGYGGEAGHYDEARDIAISSSGYVYVVGTRHAGFHTDWWIKKFSRNGVQYWEKIIDNAGGNDEAWAIAVFN